MKMLHLFGKDFNIFYNIFQNGNVNNPKFIQQGFLRNDFLDRTLFVVQGIYNFIPSSLAITYAS